jgi:hypothetical protein
MLISPTAKSTVLQEGLDSNHQNDAAAKINVDDSPPRGIVVTQSLWLASAFQAVN